VFQYSGTREEKTRYQENQSANRGGFCEEIPGAFTAENTLARASKTDSGIGLARLKQNYTYQKQTNRSMKDK